MTTPEDDGPADRQPPNWQERTAPGPRAMPQKDDAQEDLAARLWGEPEEDDA